jgi:twitching motility protein PilT
MTSEMIKEILKFGVQNNASDVHLSSGMPPIIRILGEIKKVDMEELDEVVLREQLMLLLNDQQKKHFSEFNEIDLAVHIPEVARFRLNIFQHLRGIGASFRIIYHKIRSIEELLLPNIVKSMVRNKKGLILVTGPTGSGKSTSLAAMIQEINLIRREHIISIEDPIEYVFEPENCLIHQREAGEHTGSFASALRSALREDPDVILVGEMRDLETITHALRAAETGHLVLSTLHTNSAAETIDRIISAFPSKEQLQIQNIFANTLISVISQRLAPMAIKQDRVAIMEILVATKAVKNLIREGKSHQIESAIQTGHEFGMQSFEKSFEMLQHNNLISPQLNLKDFV